MKSKDYNHTKIVSERHRWKNIEKKCAEEDEEAKKKCAEDEEDSKKKCSELETSETHIDINLSNNGEGNIKTTSIASLLAKRNKRF